MAIKDSTRITGIYKITCSGNNKFYIGSSVCIKSRWSAHRHMLRNNKHGNKHIQNSWNKYGEESFSFEVVERCSDTALIEREQYWIDTTNCAEVSIGMNNSRTASTSVGYKHSEQTLAKLKKIAAERGPEHYKKVADAQRGRPRMKGVSGWVWTDAHRMAASLSRKGRPAWNKGIPHSDEVKERIAVSTSLALRVIPEEKRNEIKALRISGMSYPKISAQLGISISQCHKIFNNVRGQYKSIKQ